MIAERVVRGFWPVWTIGFALLAPVLLGVLPDIPLEIVWAGLVLGLLGIAYFLYRGWRQFRFPTMVEAMARVDARLPGRPISALHDAQAIGAGDPASIAIWNAHIDRMRERTRDAKPVAPNLSVATADPYGLRYIALLAVTVGVLFGSASRGTAPAMAGPQTDTMTASGPSWEGWIEPPSYTGKPTLYLSDVTGRVEVPKGSRVTLRFYGDVGDLTLAETVSARTADMVPPASDQSQTFDIMQDGEISIRGAMPRAWNIAVQPDAMPFVELTGPVQADAMGVMTQPFYASDDYGITGGQVAIELDLTGVDRRYGLMVDPDPIAPLVVDLPIPISGNRAEFDEALIEDFSQHILANMPVTIAFEVTDALGQVGAAEPEQIVLPGRRFFRPVTKAVIEQRRDLMWSKSNAPRVASMLRAIAYQPEQVFRSPTFDPIFRGIIAKIEQAVADGSLDEDTQADIAQNLWDLAIELEEGALADARERLNRAQERLAEAMRNGASPEEIQELMQELRDATDDYMDMLAEQMPDGDGSDQPDNSQDTNEITQDEIDALMDRIQELMNEGRMAEAAELMEQLNQLLQNLQMQQSQSQNGEGSPGQQSMEQLGDTLRDQQELNDDAFNDLQDRAFGKEGEEGEEQDGQDLADRQRELRELLEQQRRNLPVLPDGQEDAARRSLEQAERSMDRAEQALRDENLPEAVDRQAEAIDALREGMRQLGEALTQSEETDPEADGESDGVQRGQRQANIDPLGRQSGTEGPAGTDQSMMQEDVQRRAGELMDEIRRRAGELDRDELELDYLRRLLDRF